MKIFINLPNNRLLLQRVAVTFGIFLSLAIHIGCTRKANDSSLITLSLPASGAMSSKLDAFTHTPDSHMSQNVGVYSNDDGPEWNILLNPATIADVNCYMIAIAGPESDMRRNICTTTSGQAVYIGRWVGAMSAGQQLTIEVPSGSQREIMVIGFKASAGSCTNFKTAEPNSANLSEPHIIGKVVQNLSPGDVTVSVPVTVSSNTLKIADCQGPDFNLGEGNQMYFGSAPAGDTTYDYTVPTGPPTTHDLSSDAPSAPVNLKAAYGMVSALDVTTVPDATTVQLTSSTFSNFNAGDEVMVIVMGGRNVMGPSGDDDYDACGYRAWTGRYQFTKVRSKSTSPNNKLVLEKGTFVDTLWKDADVDGIYFEATDDIQAANGTMINPYNSSSSPFCRLQIVKVPHFNTLLVQNGSTLTAPVFDWINGGGVLAFRANELALGGSSVIEMDHKGFQGVNDFNGDGISGRPTSASATANANGGGRGAASATAGGGGHGNEPQSPYVGPYSSSGGNGNTSGGAGGHGVGDDCGATPSQSGYCFGSLSYKMFMGGAGGGAAGRVHTLSCTGQHFDSSAISLTGGGTGGGSGTAVAGLDSMSVISSVPCP